VPLAEAVMQAGREMNLAKLSTTGAEVRTTTWRP
jgi:hypothetical protein